MAKCIYFYKNVEKYSPLLNAGFLKYSFLFSTNRISYFKSIPQRKIMSQKLIGRKLEIELLRQIIVSEKSEFVVF